MISQIRIYTNEMDNFMVLHQKSGVPIVARWVNRPQTNLFGFGPTKIRRSYKRQFAEHLERSEAMERLERLERSLI
jgi:hypothetical protein